MSTTLRIHHRRRSECRFSSAAAGRSRCRSRSRIVGAALIGLALTTAADVLAQARELKGGANRIPLTAGIQNPTLVFKNNTGGKIADFTITVESSPVRITGANVVDNNQGGEDWDVDDNGNGSLDGGENANGPGAEGADPAAGNADNQQAAGASVRLEEDGRNQPIDPFRTVEVDLNFDSPPGKGAVIVVQATSGRGRPLVSAVATAAEGGLVAGGLVDVAFEPAIRVVALELVTDDGSHSFRLGELRIPAEFLKLAEQLPDKTWSLRLEGRPAKPGEER